jgi:Probable transposase.
VSNARNDFLHKLSKSIIDDNQVIVVEDRALSAHFNSKEHSQALKSSENGLWHTTVKFDTSITKALKQDLEQDKEALSIFLGCSPQYPLLVIFMKLV